MCSSLLPRLMIRHSTRHMIRRQHLARPSHGPAHGPAHTPFSIRHCLVPSPSPLSSLHPCRPSNEALSRRALCFDAQLHIERGRLLLRVRRHSEHADSLQQCEKLMYIENRSSSHTHCRSTRWCRPSQQRCACWGRCDASSANVRGRRVSGRLTPPPAARRWCAQSGRRR